MMRRVLKALGTLALAALAFYVVDRWLASQDSSDEPASMAQRTAVHAALARGHDARRVADSLHVAERVADSLRQRQRTTRDSLRSTVTLEPTPGIVLIRDSLHTVPIEVTALLASDDTLIAGLTRDKAAAREEADSLRSAGAQSDTAHAIVVDTLTRAVQHATARTHRAYLVGGAVGAVVVVVVRFFFHG